MSVMKYGAFIQSNRKQLLGAKIAKHALETRGGLREREIPVTIMNVEDFPVFIRFKGMTYRRGEETRTHDEKDLQFFTLSRFMPPELMGYQGRALVIDPDIFALKNIGEVLDIDLHGNALGACKKKDAWDSSVMILDTEKLHHWNIEKILTGLQSGAEDYRSWMQLRKENGVLELPRIWNSLDEIHPDTRMLHTTIRLTQPWKTGLQIDFTPGTIPTLFGIIPRFWVSKPTHYQPHPDKNIEALFFDLAKETLAEGAITHEEVVQAIAEKNIRADFFEKLEERG